MQVQDVMTKDVAAVAPDDRLSRLLEILSQHHVSGAPVLDANRRVVGIVSEGDLLRRTELGTDTHHSPLMDFLLSSGRLAREYAHAHSRVVSDIMTPGAVVVGPEAPLATAVDLMETHHVKRLPVVHSGVCVGVISRADIVQALAPLLDEPGVATDDATVKARIDTELKAQPWANRSLTVHVADGCVNLRGVVFHESERDALRTLLAAIPGVTSLRDELVWIEPMTGTVCAVGEPAATI